MDEHCNASKELTVNKNRIISLDTETTGLNPDDGHKIIELAMVEIIDLNISSTWRSYFNPCRTIDIGASEIHGITSDLLITAPFFSHKSREILDFIGDSKLLIHNAPFDLSFINKELLIASRVNGVDYGQISDQTNEIIDTCKLSRMLHPGGPASLNACLDRYGIDRTSRTKHGALIDATLLANLYAKMCHYS
jgi:DNA polymerase-3 subunit epsilon